MTNQLIGSKNPRIEVRTNLDGILMTQEQIEEQARLEAEGKGKPEAPENVQPPKKEATPVFTKPIGAGDYWEIPGVNYRGKIGNAQVLKTLLDNGQAKTQDDWVAYSHEARATGRFYVPDYPLFFATLQRAYTLKTNPTIEEAKQKIKEFSRANWLMTLTRIRYSPDGKDKIFHNHGMSDQYELEEPFRGADGKIPAGSPETVYQKLLGTKISVADINSVFKWLNDTDAYIWRVNSKPKKLDERVAGFVAVSDGAGLICGWDPSGADPALGVRFVEP